jgi:hypothetical protein
MKSWMRALFALTVLVVGASSQLSCSVNDYCLNCAIDDSGNGDGDGGSGDGDGGMTDDDALGDAGCNPTGTEECDGKDNDCNGLVDDGVLPGVGDLCANQMGQCAGGVNQCTNGSLKCDKSGLPETCNGLDDDCDGTADDGDPGGGGKCGIDTGECVAGQFHCDSVTHTITCVGFIDTTGAAELCDAKDQDCDGKFDEGLNNLGTCGPANEDGLCRFGTLVCQGGAPVCQNAVFPTGEVCNDADDDCDNDVDELFNKTTDPFNCGMCGNACTTQPNANTVCTNGSCGFTCKPGFHDLIGGGGVNAGCEYGPCFASGVEECDGLDNDCNGIVDDMLNPPSICRSGGECGATAPVAQCGGAAGWTCNYPGTVQFPETKCDGLNNDCDANIDEGQSNLGQACDDGRQGVCRGTGVFACNTANPDGPATCSITQPGQANPDAQETCDNRDNNCNGTIDEGSETGNLLGQEWVTIGGGVQIMKYEASRFDSSSSQQGTIAAKVDVPLAASPTGATQSGSLATFTTLGNHSLVVGNKIRINGVGVSGYNGLWTVSAVPSSTTFRATLATSGLAASGGGFVAKYRGACSRQGVMPWTNITYPEALAACESMGATLCTETKWHQACSVVAPATKPIVIDGGATGTLIEAEDFTNNNANGVPESGGQCSNTVDDDGDGVINDGCPTVVSGVGPESGGQCANNTDDDADGRINDGCPAAEIGTGPETSCTDTLDNDGDGRVNDGCPAAALGAGPETGAQCNNNSDDDGDGRDNDGCPDYADGVGPETGTQCSNNGDDDSDGRDNDGCPAVFEGVGPETGNQCNNNGDDDGDGRDNDGCPTVGSAPESGNQCLNNSDDDGDNRDNDGCPAVERGAETGTQCDNNSDDDSDGVDNDGCPAVAQGVGPETGNQCNNNSDDDGDGRDNDGCPATSFAPGPETGNQCNNNTDSDADGVINDGCPAVAGGVGPETGTACNNNTDDDADGVTNDGCPATQGGAETGNQCGNSVDDDGDGFMNDGCPSGSQAWVEDYTQDDPATTPDDRHSGMSNMRAVPNNGADIPQATAHLASPRLDYAISIPTDANDWRVWVRMFAPTTNDDTLHVGIGPSAPTASMTLTTTVSAAPAGPTWVWVQTPALDLDAGANTLSLFMARDGLKVDRIFIVRGSVTPPTTLGPAGGVWSYATSPSTYNGATCNGADQSAANDNVLATGSLTSCYANHAGTNDVYDMSGNVKEWTLARLPGQNPIRGGASNDLATGISCALNFTLGNDTFFFPNVGFRCCR